jgi:hypothetical protein
VLGVTPSGFAATGAIGASLWIWIGGIVDRGWGVWMDCFTVVFETTR